MKGTEAVKSWQELEEEYNNVINFNLVPDMEFLEEGFVTDEDMSVRWNREQVEQNHRDYVKEEERLKKEKEKALSAFNKSLFWTVKKNMHSTISLKTAELIWQYVLEGRENEQDFTFPLNELLGIMDLIDSVLDVETEKKGKKAEEQKFSDSEKIKK